MKYTKQEIAKAKQWISDVYHCSGCWGNRQTYEEMKLELSETMIQKDIDDYSPPIEMYRICARYWNKLCKYYPS